jgi:hypothetical protein
MKRGRREFVAGLAGTSLLYACGGGPPAAPSTAGAEAARDGLPRTRPEGWDPIAFNRARGNAGAIPESYRDAINGPDGATAHLGKHLPYVPTSFAGEVPEGTIPLMWGDPDRGFARHPNADRSEANGFEGHWYDWVRLREATDGDAAEVESTFTGWPTNGPDATGAYGVLGGGDIADDDGKNTVYVVRLPAGVGPGDTLRVHAHCLTHGEYVDFITL